MRRKPYIKRGRKKVGIKGVSTDRIRVAHDDVDGLRKARHSQHIEPGVQLETPQCIACHHFMGNHNGARCFVGGCRCDSA